VFMPELSDNSLLEVHMPCCKPAAVPLLLERRARGRFDKVEFFDALRASPLCLSVI